MPLNAFGWTTEEDEKLAELVQPHTHLYNVLDPSRKNILARESTWQEIAQVLAKPGECILYLDRAIGAKKMLCCIMRLQKVS